jgi:hypothetical protein
LEKGNESYILGLPGPTDNMAEKIVIQTLWASFVPHPLSAHCRQDKHGK